MSFKKNSVEDFEKRYWGFMYWREKNRKNRQSEIYPIRNWTFVRKIKSINPLKSKWRRFGRNRKIIKSYA